MKKCVCNYNYFRISVANKRFSVGWSMSWGSEGHFDAPVGPGELLISTS